MPFLIQTAAQVRKVNDVRTIRALPALLGEVFVRAAETAPVSQIVDKKVAKWLRLALSPRKEKRPFLRVAYCAGRWIAGIDGYTLHMIELPEPLPGHVVGIEPNGTTHPILFDDALRLAHDAVRELCETEPEPVVLVDFLAFIKATNERASVVATPICTDGAFTYMQLETGARMKLSATYISNATSLAEPTFRRASSNTHPLHMSGTYLGADWHTYTMPFLPD